MEPSLAVNLPEKYMEIPISALGFSVRKIIAVYLNPDGQITAHIKYENNFRGLAELAGFSYQEIRNFERLKNPTEELLDEWTTRLDLSPTIGSLCSLLSYLERVDVLTECLSIIESDCEVYLQKKARFEPPLQVEIVSNSTDIVSCDQITCEPLTRHDVKYGSPTTYDAFVCYNDSGLDQDFVLLMISELERERDLKLFIPQRDDLAGTEGNTTSARLIQDRCKKMVAILSPRFLNSPACEFQVQFANSLDAGTRQKKIIPVLIEDCETLDVPYVLRHLTLCDYTRTHIQDWFWEKLYMSLKAPLGPTCKNDKLCTILAMRNNVCQADYWQNADKIGRQYFKQDLQKETQSPKGPPQTSTTSMTLQYTTETAPISVDAKTAKENLIEDKTSETTVPNISTPQSGSFQACIDDSTITNHQLRASRVVYRRTGSRSPQVSSAENRAPVPNGSQHAYLPKKRSSSPPERCDSEPDTKAMHCTEPVPSLRKECSQSLKTPVEHDESCG